MDSAKVTPRLGHIGVDLDRIGASRYGHDVLAKPVYWIKPFQEGIQRIKESNEALKKHGLTQAFQPSAAQGRSDVVEANLLRNETAIQQQFSYLANGKPASMVTAPHPPQGKLCEGISRGHVSANQHPFWLQNSVQFLKRFARHGNVLYRATPDHIIESRVVVGQLVAMLQKLKFDLRILMKDRRSGRILNVTPMQADGVSKFVAK